MREIDCGIISMWIEKLFIEACCSIGPDVEKAIEKSMEKEDSPFGRDILNQILENMRYAREENIPACQDTGMAVVFLEVGQDIHITGGYINDAVNEGVKRAYENGYLRKSVVKSPVDRINTGDNTPAVIHTKIVPGDRLKITAVPKGFGSENMSAIKMLKPSDGIEGIKKFVLDTVLSASSNPCPPIILGIGIGGTFETCALLAKKALLRPLGEINSDPLLSSLEEAILNEVNKTGIGPQGLGGRTTCLGVSILSYPTHIAGLPAAVNIQCHASRHREIIL
jgi:hydro-lyases, Fe-S type, tartrate/fumarate subfamily, alpha region